MIRVRVGRTGYIPIEFSKFPDGTSSFRFHIEKVGGSEENAPITVEWKYDGDHECILLWYLVKHIQYLYDQPTIHHVAAPSPCPMVSVAVLAAETGMLSIP